MKQFYDKIYLFLVASQYLASSGDETECQRCYGVRVPAQDHRSHAVILRQDIRRKYQEQFCSHL